jgi:hypothetical protein
MSRLDQNSSEEFKFDAVNHYFKKISRKFEFQDSNMFFQASLGTMCGQVPPGFGLCPESLIGQDRLGAGPGT